MARGRIKQKGIVLFIVVATIFILILLGNILLSIITSHARLTHHQISRIQAYYAAMAGINYALEMLRIGPPSGWAVGVSCTSPCTLPLFSSDDFKPASIVGNSVSIIIRQPQSTNPSSPCYNYNPPGNSACVYATAEYTYTR